MDSDEERIGVLKDRSEVITLPAAQKDRKKPWKVKYVEDTWEGQACVEWDVQGQEWGRGKI